MSRGLWFVAGAGAGVWGMARARRAAEAFTSGGLRDRLSALALGARLVGQEFSTGAAEREVELRQRLGLEPHGPARLEEGRPAEHGRITAGDTGRGTARDIARDTGREEDEEQH